MEKCLTCGLPTRVEVPITGTTGEFVTAVIETISPAYVCPIAVRMVADRRDAHKLSTITDAAGVHFYKEGRVGSGSLMARSFLGFPLTFVDGPEITGRLVLIHC